MSASWKRINYNDVVKTPYKKTKNDGLSTYKGLSVSDFNSEDDEFEDFDKYLIEE